MGGTIVGIDLGTTNSLVAVCDERGPRILHAPGESPLVPSVVRFEGAGVVVGEAAKAEAGEHPLTTISSAKRLMGRAASELGADAAALPYRVEAGTRGTSRIVLPDGRPVSPEEVSAAVLRELKLRAERELDGPVEKAVVTVPAYFDDAQRQATRVAGRLAGLDVIRLVPEPTAAALAYGLGLHRAPGSGPLHVVVYDLGGGTFDVSVLRLTPGTAEEPFFFQVLAVGGDTRLGGDDVDRLLAREVWGDDAEDAGERRRRMAEAERLKILLSDRDEVPIGGTDRVLTRAELETLIDPLVKRTIEISRDALQAAGGALAGAAIDAVVLVGGSTRIPLVRRRVAEWLGIEPYTALDPDQVVALGASVQARILSGDTKNALLLDVIPLSLGIETVGGGVSKLIVRNATVPARASEMFSTSVDGQTSIRLRVYQGEREMASDCRMLGEFHLRGLPPMPAGVPQVQVQFLVDANGVLSVAALERRSGRRATLQVVPNHGLTTEEVERIERESILHARDDMTRHRVADLITNSRLDLKWIGEGLARHGAALEPAAKAELDGLVARLREMVDAATADWRSVNPDAMYQAKEALDRASMRLQEIAIAASLRGQQTT